MKDPAFLFYPNDWIGGTMGMTFEEKGAYIELLMMQFNRGHMTLHMIGQTIGQLWDKIQDKFVLDNEGRYYNVRLEEEQNKRKSFTESRRNNIKGENQYTKKEGHKDAHVTSHMENENENAIKDIIDYLNNKTGKNFKYNTPNTTKHINARLTEKYSIDDFKKVIDIKTAQWLNDPKMKIYLRPDTLFSPKFEGYINECTTPEPKKTKQLTLQEAYN